MKKSAPAKKKSADAQSSALASFSFKQPSIPAIKFAQPSIPRKPFGEINPGTSRTLFSNMASSDHNLFNINFNAIPQANHHDLIANNNLGILIIHIFFFYLYF